MAEAVGSQIKNKVEENVKGTSSVCRHSITWWRSRCVALEHENKQLRDKVRSLAQRRGYRDTRQGSYHRNDDARDEDRKECDTSNEDLEFNVTEDVLNFFETSERHKREMRRKRRSSQEAHEEENSERNSEEAPFVGGAESVRMRKEAADLLYGDAGSKILTLEAALQSAVERYEDTANSQYWPNIPFKL